LWLELQQKFESRETATDVSEHTPLNVAEGLEAIVAGKGRYRLETLDLPEFLVKQRWFAGKAAKIQSTRIVDWVTLDSSHSTLTFVEVRSTTGKTDTYLLPLAITMDGRGEEVQRSAPNAVLAPVVSGDMEGFLHDGIFDDSLCALIFSLIERNEELVMHRGRIRATQGAVFPKLIASADTPLPVRRSSAEQSNTSVIYGDRFILKVFRHQESGLNPDAEIGRYLTEHTSFDRIPPYAGIIEYVPAEGERTALAMLQGLVANEGDGWTWTLEELDRYYESCAPIPFPETASAELVNAVDLSERPTLQLAMDQVGIYLDSAAVLGRRTAELHRALASVTNDPAFVPEPFTSTDLDSLLARLREHASGVFDLLKERISVLPDEVFEIAASVLGQRRRILEVFGALKGSSLHTHQTRIHGDYHLGQVLRVKRDFVILDFEGEPARPLSERRLKQSPLKDVAGMLRSFSYAAYASLINYTIRHPEDIARLEPWAQLWERSVGAEFLRAYREITRDTDFLSLSSRDFRKLLHVFLLDKALYEVLYELNSRPVWVRIPLMGIMSMG
jgi:maltose alpha-D-glucosyltransferase / alpha-amylase